MIAFQPERGGCAQGCEIPKVGCGVGGKIGASPTSSWQLKKLKKDEVESTKERFIHSNYTNDTLTPACNIMPLSPFNKSASTAFLRSGVKGLSLESF